MPQVPALLSLVLTMGLVLARPRFGSFYRAGPAFAASVGVLVMVLARLVDRGDLTSTAVLMWRPLLAVASIMVTTAVAQRLGLMDWLAAVVEERGSGDARSLFRLVYALSATTAAVLNNDSAILLLTPAVVALVRRRFPNRPDLVVPFAFAVFMAAGTAPFVVSNPMNMIVAAYAGIDFNQYALRMAPIAAAGWALSYVILEIIFRKRLRDGGAPSEMSATEKTKPSRAQVHSLVLVLGVLVAYPIVALAGGPVWVVASAGACAALALASRHQAGGTRAMLRTGISWEILVFLGLVSVIGVGLRNAGIVQRLTVVYEHGGIASIGAVSAIGSAVVNNHPMSIINMLALRDVPGAGMRDTLAALIGGDLGPRLLPVGSLAGLLWLEALRRSKIDVSPVRFILIGGAVTIPTIALSLALLAAIT